MYMYMSDLTYEHTVILTGFCFVFILKLLAPDFLFGLDS